MQVVGQVGAAAISHREILGGWRVGKGKRLSLVSTEPQFVIYVFRLYFACISHVFRMYFTPQTYASYLNVFHSISLSIHIGYYGPILVSSEN